jgi:putative Flp pilus-assembly TadE/G-like protein
MRRRQSGQAIVLAGVSLLALTLMLALVLVGGTLYWERRHLQSLADSAALAGANVLTTDCATVMATSDPRKNPVYAAGTVLAAQLGTRTDVSFTGTSCATGYTAIFSYPDSPYGGTVTATVHYPYNHLDTQVEVLVNAASPLQIGGISTSRTANVASRAVAKFQASSLPGGYALYSADGITCEGAQQLSVDGSVYSGGPISGNCNLYAHAIFNKVTGTYADFGDILVYPPGQDWMGGKGSPSCAGGQATGNVVCADGFELSGTTPSQCATTPTMYLDTSQGGAGEPNPNPCSNPPPVPAPDLRSFLPKEPNTVAAAVGTLKGGACSSTDKYLTPVLAGYAPTVLTAPTGTSAGVKTLSVAPLTMAVPNNTTILLGTQSLTLSKAAGPGAVSLDVNAFNPSTDYAAGSKLSFPMATPIGRSRASWPLLEPDSHGYYPLSPDCYGWLDIGLLPSLPGQHAGAAMAYGLYYFNGSALAADAVSGGGLCLAQSSTLVGQAVTMEFVNATSFSVGSCDSVPKDASGVTSFGASPAVDGYTIPAGDIAQWLAAPDKSSAWCTTQDCLGLLVWAPPAGYAGLSQIQGTFDVKGPSASYWLKGTVYWPGEPAGGKYPGCEVQANAGSEIEGQLLCQSVDIQGGAGSPTAAIDWVSGGGNTGPQEAGLTE